MRLRRAAWWWGPGLVIAIAACHEPRVGSPHASSGDEHALLGAPAPAFARPRVGGGVALSTDSVKGKVLIVDFWATWCKPCVEAFPKLQEIVDKHEDAVVIFALSEDDTEDVILPFVRKSGVKFPIGWDEGNVISRRYKLDKMPTSYVIDQKGIVRFVHAGYAEGEDRKIAGEVGELLRQ
ncbi:MAG TPA: TlpA disulfide reductase family protein [Polyangiaceae bacterium]